ncbi:MAG: hypothetical protein ABW352_22455 [Polyangiales bacterium]
MDEASGGKPRKPGKTTSKKKTSEDKLLIHGVSEDGEKLSVLRARGDRVEAGIVSKVKDGEPLHGELVKLTPHADFPLLCDVDVELAAPNAGAPKLSHGGPAQVATPSYRANWDAIFQKKPRPSQLN